MLVSEKILQQLRFLPNNPGVYQFLDSAETIIYVGKAKDLKKRVSSYFNRDRYEQKKTQVLVKNITTIKYIVVDSEIDALLLENNLIKKHQPKYNIQLKDDKTYPWICIKREPFPRVFGTRTIIKDGSEYYGPYASVKVMHALLDLTRQLFKLRTCGLNLTKENIEKGKFKVCLEYHIGNCLGPCVANQEPEDYNESISQIRDIIKGNAVAVIRYLKNMMHKYVTALEFEKAQAIKEKLDLLERFQSKSTVVSPTIHNVDIFSLLEDENNAYINFIKVSNGAIIQGHTIELKKKIEESKEEMLMFGIAELRHRFQSNAEEIVVPFEPGMELPGVRFTVPQKGDKKKLLELSEKNLEYYQKEKQKQEDLIDPERHTKRILKQMMKDLRLKEEPRHIECFDNSNIQGAHPVAAMTVFKDARPCKSEYRHFNIKTVEGPNDFASMEEVIYRRYKRVLDEQKELPQLIVIDGGKGQLSAALESLDKLGLRGKVGIIGIAKKLEEIYFPGDSIPIYLDKKSETLKIIQHIRNEAHRFGITHHRKKRSKATIKTELNDIKGISDATSQKLLSTFKSVKRIKELTLQELTESVGLAKAKLVFDHFHKPDLPLN